MTEVLIDGGRSYSIDAGGRTADAVAAEVAAAVLDPAEGARFSLKVNGTVLKPDESIALADGDVVELVDVTDYTWPEPAPVEPAPVALEETGSVVTEPSDTDDSDRKRRGGRGTTAPDADTASD